ncbi:hypothetical protein J6590_009324 [Homalodisca vitripennis]|nr:hypothetical protein J6590_009324 [Homalodisca vitripennis]
MFEDCISVPCALPCDKQWDTEAANLRVRLRINRLTLNDKKIDKKSGSKLPTPHTRIDS